MIKGMNAFRSYWHSRGTSQTPMAIFQNGGHADMDFGVARISTLANPPNR